MFSLLADPVASLADGLLEGARSGGACAMGAWRTPKAGWRRGVGCGNSGQKRGNAREDRGRDKLTEPLALRLNGA